MSTAPVTPDEFDAAMRAIGPFERPPRLAVAVSGGADSMALALLAHRWAAAQGGRVTALTVDHGLRAGSADEAQATAVRLGARGIEHETLPWHGAKPGTAIQAEARQARYRLLEDRCRALGILHLLVAHHADDQAETMLMRLERGSGPDGLAAMAPVREFAGCRLLRPLLDVPKARLIATLLADGMAWAEDPSNRDDRFARTAVRRRLQGADVAGIARGAARFGRVRALLETEQAAWLARHARLYQAGYVTLDAVALAAAADEIRLRVLARAAQTVTGADYAPAVAGVERLWTSLAAGRGATLGGAHFVPAEKTLGVYREARNLPDAVPLSPSLTRWDRRFDVQVGEFPSGARLRPWTPALGRAWPRRQRPDWIQGLPDAARPGLPVVENGGVLSAPEPGGAELVGVSVRFRSKMPLAGGGFNVA